MSARIKLGLLASSGAAIVALLAVGACTVETSVTSVDAGVYDGSIDAAASTCVPCVVNTCTAAWAVCLTDEGCRQVRACADPMAESSGAVQECACSAEAGADAGTTAQAAYQMFASCNDARTCTTCGTECASSCSGGGAKTTVPSCSDGDAGADADGGIADADTDAGDADADAAAPAPAPVTVDGCSSCVDGKCGDPKKQCATGTECAAFLGCVSACASDEACVDGCGQKHATGKAAAVGLASCTLAACSAACGL